MHINQHQGASAYIIGHVSRCPLRLQNGILHRTRPHNWSGTLRRELSFRPRPEVAVPSFTPLYGVTKTAQSPLYWMAIFVMFPSFHAQSHKRKSPKTQLPPHKPQTLQTMHLSWWPNGGGLITCKSCIMSLSFFKTSPWTPNDAKDSSFHRLELRDLRHFSATISTKPMGWASFLFMVKYQLYSFCPKYAWIFSVKEKCLWAQTTRTLPA